MKTCAKVFSWINAVTSFLGFLSGLIFGILCLTNFKQFPKEIQEIFKDGEAEAKTYGIFLVVLAIVALAATVIAIFSLIALKKSTKKDGKFIALGVLNIVFGEATGIVSGILMLCLKPRHFGIVEDKTEVPAGVNKTAIADKKVETVPADEPIKPVATKPVEVAKPVIKAPVIKSTDKKPVAKKVTTKKPATKKVTTKKPVAKKGKK